TAQEQPFDVLIQYPLHPRAGERVVVVRRLHHGGSIHFVVEQPDSTRALLPAWMTEPWAARLTIIEMPRLTLEALHGLRSAINGALLSLSSSSMMRGKCDDGSTSQPPAARSARARGQRARAKPNTTTDSVGSDVSANAADGGAHRRCWSWSAMNKITPEHLTRDAYVYVRQSTADQLLNNPESRRRQYALVTRARVLGWENAIVIDDDLGRSGGGQVRPGF